MYFSNISDTELSQYHNEIKNDVEMSLTQVLSSSLFKIETIIADKIYKIYPLFYCDNIESTNPNDKIVENRLIICEKEANTILKFETQPTNDEVELGWSIYIAVGGFVIHCYNKINNKPVTDLELIVTLNNKVITVKTNEKGEYLYNVGNSVLMSVSLSDGTVLYSYDKNEGTLVKYYWLYPLCENGYGNLTGENITIWYDDGVVYEYTGSSTLKRNTGLGDHEVFIKGNVTELGSLCFWDTQIKSIILQDSITTLGISCFSNCTQLESIDLSNNLTAIPYNCFHNCENLHNILIPASVSSIDCYSFELCDNLEEIFLKWDTSESIVTYSGCWRVPSHTVFVVPIGTKDLYLDKGYPSERVVERGGFKC